MPDVPTAPSFRFETAAFPELTGPKSPSTRCVPLASAAAKLLFSVANPGAAWLAAAPGAATAADSVDRHPTSQPSPARSVDLAEFMHTDSSGPDANAFAALDLSGYRATDDTTSSGPVEPTSTKVDGEQATLALSPRSSTSGKSFVVVPETPTPPVSTPFPVLTTEMEESTTAVGDVTAVVETAPTERAGVIRGRHLRPPNLRIADVLKICTRIGVADIDDAVLRLAACRHMPFTPEVLRRIFHAVIATRRHTASRLLEHLAYLRTTMSSDSEILMEMCHHLQHMLDRETRS